METVIVPVDFSATSVNAARYAVQLLTGHYGVNMVLYHMYEKPKEKAETEQKLHELKAELLELGIVKIETLNEHGSDFIDELEKLARHRQADLIIMGITGRSGLAQTLVGSNTIRIVERKASPVLIVPPKASYHEVRNVLLASDFKDVERTTPTVPVKKVLKTFRPNLHVINVDSNHYVALTEDYQTEKSKLKEMFRDFNPEFYFLGWYDVDEAINQFAHDKNIDFIIVIHKEHSLFSRIFGKSHTRELAYHSSVPVLALHE
ncbi:MAG TPA: universal stress protein [Chitinophagaceae bacterium]|nr:universal stress protein [Chitinophagaceae bacterium]